MRCDTLNVHLRRFAHASFNSRPTRKSCPPCFGPPAFASGVLAFQVGGPPNIHYNAIAMLYSLTNCNLTRRNGFSHCPKGWRRARDFGILQEDGFPSLPIPWFIYRRPTGIAPTWAPKSGATNRQIIRDELHRVPFPPAGRNIYLIR